jgi:hypothetical protein
MNLIQQIEDAIVTGVDLREAYRNDLHVTIRIAKDFYDFLVKNEEAPDESQIDHIAGTIRSGIDEYYSLAYGCRSILRSGKGNTFGPNAHWDFPALRENFMRAFDRLADSDASVTDRLGSLLFLTHLELVFLARHFPSAVLAERASDSMTVQENLQAIKKMIGGKASWSRDDD